MELGSEPYELGSEEEHWIDSFYLNLASLYLYILNFLIFILLIFFLPYLFPLIFLIFILLSSLSLSSYLPYLYLLIFPIFIFLSSLSLSSYLPYLYLRYLYLPYLLPYLPRLLLYPCQWRSAPSHLEWLRANGAWLRII